MSSSLIQKAKSWDLLAFGDLYDASYDRVYRFLFYRTLDTVTTEDLISDVYMKAMKGITRFRWESEWEWYSWILQIAYTTFIDSTRTTHDETSLDEIEWEPSYNEDIDTTIDNRNKLREVLDYINTNLSERDKNIIMMRIWDDMSYEDISRITGESVSNSKKIVSRALQKISANVSAFCLLALVLQHVITK
jgi:RNA polymerase sigma-70 factor (ECF subfamily)